jgi:hypothetical protein
MRRLACVALTIIALHACIAYRLTTTDPEGNTKTRTGLWLGPIPIIRRIRTELSRVQEDVSTRRAQLQPLRCGSDECYSAEAVNAAIATIRQEVRAAFPDEAVASAISLDEEIAQASAELVASNRRNLVQFVRNPPDFPSPVYLRPRVDRVFQRINGQISNYLAHSELNPTIHISSNPAGAKFEMQIGNNERTKRAAVTDDDLQSVWRGHYSGRLVKAGYRDAQPFMLDLMNDSRTKVRCTLASTTAPATEESICRFEN